jgi:hypothetical protein
VQALAVVADHGLDGVSCWRSRDEHALLIMDYLGAEADVCFERLVHLRRLHGPRESRMYSSTPFLTVDCASARTAWRSRRSTPGRNDGRDRPR